MEAGSFIDAARNRVGEKRSTDIKKKKAATDFEKIFARRLVSEMTKDSFKMGDNNSLMGHSNDLYREFITDTLAEELAKQHKLGMADLVTKYWNRPSASPNRNS